MWAVTHTGTTVSGTTGAYTNVTATSCTIPTINGTNVAATTATATTIKTATPFVATAALAMVSVDFTTSNPITYSNSRVRAGDFCLATLSAMDVTTNSIRSVVCTTGVITVTLAATSTGTVVLLPVQKGY